MQKTAIIIPCYNEENRLNCEKIIKFTEHNPEIFFIMVNDGSSDNTADMVNNLAESNCRQIIALHLRNNLGKAEAVRQGFLNAFTKKFDIIGYWDADLAAPLSEIEHLLNHLSSVKSIVFGARVRLMGRLIIRKSVRHYLGRFFATMVSFALNLVVYDTQCGAKIFRNTRELEIVFSSPFTVTWIFDVELIARFIMLSKFSACQSVNIMTVEYPLRKWTDIPGSKLKFIDFIKAGNELLRIGHFLHAPGKEARYNQLIDHYMSKH